MQDTPLRAMAILLPTPIASACLFGLQPRRGALCVNGTIKSCFLGSSLHRGSWHKLSAERGALLIVRASNNDMASNENDFDLAKCVQSVSFC